MPLVRVKHKFNSCWEHQIVVFLQQQIQVLLDATMDLEYNPYLLSMSRQRKVLLTICIDSSTSKYLLPRWWNGRHVGLRSQCRKA